MKNKKVVFINIDKIKLEHIEKDCKYVLLTNEDYKNIDLSEFTIKPIIVAYNGSLGIDMATNKILFNNYLRLDDIKKLLNYADTHNVEYKAITYDNQCYMVSLKTKNYSRMLIIPSLFKELLKDSKVVYERIIKIDDYYCNYVISKNVSFVTNLSTIIEYLKIKSSNFIELEHISSLISENINTIGYCIGYNNINDFKINNKLKGILIYEN